MWLTCWNIWQKLCNNRNEINNRLYNYYMHAYIIYMNEYQSIVPPCHPLANIPDVYYLDLVMSNQIAQFINWSDDLVYSKTAYQNQVISYNKGCEVSWIPTFYHHLETVIHHGNNKDSNTCICGTSRWSESGDSHLIMISMHQECSPKLPDCVSPWCMAVWRWD